MEKTHISEGQKYPGNFLTDFKKEKNTIFRGESLFIHRTQLVMKTVNQP